MPEVTITLKDDAVGLGRPKGFATPVSITSSHKPRVGEVLSPAQAAALEIINRTRRDWGVERHYPTMHPCEALARAMLDPEDLGHACTPELRDRARVALGGVPVEGGGIL